MGERPHQSEDKYVLRLPAGMRDAVKRAADSNGRSMNAEIIHRLKQVGPAEAATSPSHGSSLSPEITMNTEKAITAGDAPASEAAPFKGYEHAFQALEMPLSDARQMATVLDHIADDMLEAGRLTGSPEEERHREELFSSMIFLTRQTLRAIDAAEDLWMQFHNAGANDAWARRG